MVQDENPKKSPNLVCRWCCRRTSSGAGLPRDGERLREEGRPPRTPPTVFTVLTAGEGMAVGEEARAHGERLRRAVKDGEAVGEVTTETTVEEWLFLADPGSASCSLVERSSTGVVSSCFLVEGTQWREGEAGFARKGEAHRGLSLRWAAERKTEIYSPGIHRNKVKSLTNNDEDSNREESIPGLIECNERFPTIKLSQTLKLDD